MRTFARLVLLLSLAALWGCTKTVLVSVPPRISLSSYPTLGIVEFASNSDPAINAKATRQFQEHIQAAQPGTRFVELGRRDALLAAMGGKQFDAATLRRIGEKYGVAAVFVGDIAYSEPKTGALSGDLPRLEAGVRAELRGDISGRLLETSTGASVWSDSAWARRQLGGVNVSAERGVSGGLKGSSNAREEMVPALIYHLTEHFRPGKERRRVE